MSTSVLSVVSHFPSAENGFTTTTSGSVSSGAATVGLNSVAGYTNGEIVVFVIDPTDISKKQTFTGVIDTAGTQVTSVVWTAGTNQTHAAGATVVDYATATHISMITKGLLVEHAQTGLHTLTSNATITSSKVITSLNDTNGNEIFKVSPTGSAVNEFTIANAATGNNPVLSATGGDTNIGITLTPKGTGNVGITSRFDGWVTGLTAPSTVTALGNRFYNLTVASTDYTDRLSPGMKLRLTRTVTAPTQCADLEASSSHYFRDTSVSGMTFTDDFVVSAWIKLESYSTCMIASRYNGTSGWEFFINANGQVTLQGKNAGAANYSYVASYASVPLNKWVHVAAQLDMSAFTATTTTSYVMIDGLDVPANVARGGTNPTALVQAGNLEIGASNGANFFDGKLAQVAVYSAKVTQANVLATMSQGLSGSETSLISAYSLSNSINDLNTGTANNLTAMNSAVATDTDTPFAGGATGTTEYAEITNVSFSTDTTIGVRVSEYGMIPTTGGVSAMAYSTQEKPFGCPHFSKILGIVQIGSSFTVTSATDTQISGLSCTVIVPTNSRIKVSVLGGALYNTTGGDGATVKIWDGVVSSGNLLNGSAQVGTGSTTYSYAPAMVVATLLASGSKTFNASLRYGSSGVAHLDSETSTGRQPYLIVELV